MSQWNTLDRLPSRIIAHRGASGYRPEHTLEGYALAAEQRADVLEPDLLMSRDGVLFARHDLGLARSTDVGARAEFAPRKREIAGVSDWWIGEFTAAELERLRATQPFPQRSNLYDGQLVVPRFSQVLDLLTSLSAQYSRNFFLYPELKNPEYFIALGLDPVAALYAELAARNLLGPTAPIWVQCFDHGVLRRTHERCGNPCFALLESVPADPAERDALFRELARWAGGVAPGKYLLWDPVGKPSGLVAAAHAHGLQVHAWTFRDDHPTAPFASVHAELEAAFAMGVDALFCDFPDTAVAARSAFIASF